MNRGRVALLLTCVVMAGLGTWFALSLSDPYRILTWMSALVTVAAIGVAVWTTWRTPPKPTDGD